MEERIINENEQNQVEDLHLDRVVASQPEIGPTPPDGGYGWLILASAIIYHITSPGLLILYGFIILKSLRNEDHEVGEKYRIWDVDIALVPVVMIVIKLLLESWCRAVVKLFHMPRFMALAGLCLTVAGVLLSSFSTNADYNDHIINVFAGIFAGSGCALTGQQTDVIITHYFRDKLTIAQRLVKIAPSIGNCLIPILIGFLSTKYTGDVVVMIYGAILMQNCFFLASYTRPVYIEKVIRHTYNMLRDAVEDEDEVIFSNQTTVAQPQRNTNTAEIANPGSSQANDDDQVVVFNTNKNAKEIFDNSVLEISNPNRFSSDFSNMRVDGNRFSSDFTNYDVIQNQTAYQELRSIEREPSNPQPLYRETTVNAPREHALSFAVNPDMTAGTARRTASLKKNFITVVNMLLDLNFYLYTLLHLCTTFSITMLGVVFPPMIWEQNMSMNVWGVATLIAISQAAALCIVMLCIILPKSLSDKSRLCAAFCTTGAIGFYGLTISSSKSFIVIWGMFAGFSTSASSILQQPIYSNMLNEFDTTVTTATANTVVATFIMTWSVVYNYEYKVCFYIASVLQGFTALVYLGASFRRQRR